MITEIAAPTKKFSSRLNSIIEKIIVHDTAGTMPGCLNWLQKESLDSSIHLLVTKEGLVYRLVADAFKAWHCRGHNQESLGIELERAKDDETGSYPDAQLAAAAECIATWTRLYAVPLNRIYSHAELDPARRRDPRNMNWYLFLLMVADASIRGNI